MPQYRETAPGHLVRVPLPPTQAMADSLRTLLAVQRAVRRYRESVLAGDWAQARAATADLSAASYLLERVANDMRPLDPATEDATDARD